MGFNSTFKGLNSFGCTMSDRLQLPDGSTGTRFLK